MSDVSYLSERVAPHSIRYSNLTPLSFEGRQMTKLYYPTNQSTYSNTNNVIRIPISSGNAFLDGGNSYLKLTFTNKNARPAADACDYTFSNSGHSLISRIRVISASGHEIENIMYYNHLHAALSDLSLDENKRLTRLHEGYSSKPKLVIAPLPDPVTTATANAAINAVVNGLFDSTLVGCNELKVAKNDSTNLYLPLELSQIVGHNKKLIPLFLTGEIILEITLADRPCMMSDITVPEQKYEVSNVSYNASIVEFSGSVNAALTQMVQSTGLFIHGTCWSNQAVPLPAGQSSSSWVNSERLKSVKSLLVTFNDPEKAGQTVGSRPTNRHNNYVSSFQVKIGSDYFPTQPIKANSRTAGENGAYLIEAFKALAEYDNVNHSSLVNIYNFASNDNAVNKTGRSVYGLDLDAFGKSDVESGVNTILSNPITFLVEKNITGVAAADILALNAYSFLLYDAIFTIDMSGNFAVSK